MSVDDRFRDVDWEVILYKLTVRARQLFVSAQARGCGNALARGCVDPDDLARSVIAEALKYERVKYKPGKGASLSTFLCKVLERDFIDLLRKGIRLDRSLETLAAYRTMQLTPFRAAIVWSTAGVVRWFNASDEFEAFISVRESVAEGTYAHDCFRGIAVPDELKNVRSDLWLALSRRVNPDYILEHSISLPSYNSVLTLLCIEAVGHSLQDDEEGTLEELSPENFTLRRLNWPR